MSKVSDPTEKKKLSLALDRRNTYGENSKASRKSIPAGKAREHRRERRTVTEILGHGHSADTVDAVVAAESMLKTRTRANRLRGFVKTPDQPLAVVLAKKAAKKARRASRKD
jgi:hypothetical protein